MSDIRFVLVGIYDNKYDMLMQVNSPIPMNVPIMFVKMGNKSGARIGFKRVKAKK